MKKIVSLVLAVMLVASLAVVASAAPAPEHANVNDWIAHGRCEWLDESDTNLCTELHRFPAWVANGLVVACADNVKVTGVAEGVVQSWVGCAQAITAAQMKEAAEAWTENTIKHMTIFRQRMLEDNSEDMTIDALNWQTGKKNRTVVLALVDETWKIVAVGEAGEKTVSATIPANAASYAVAMTW